MEQTAPTMYTPRSHISMHTPKLRRRREALLLGRHRLLCSCSTVTFDECVSERIFLTCVLSIPHGQGPQQEDEAMSARPTCGIRNFERARKPHLL